MSEPIDGHESGRVRGRGARHSRGLRIAVLTKELVALLTILFGIVLWNTDPGDDTPPPAALIATQPAHTGCSDAVSYNWDGTTLVTGGLDSRVRFWDPDRATPRGGFNVPAGVLSSAFSPDGRWLVLALTRGGLEIWDCEEQASAGSFLEEVGVLRALTFSPQGRLAAAGLDGCVRLIDPADRVVLAELRGHREPVHSLAFTPEGARLVSGGLDGQVLVWDAVEGRILLARQEARGAILRVACSPDGRSFAWSIRNQGEIQLWDLAEDRSLGVLAGHRLWTTCLAFLSDGRRILSVGGDHTVRLWDVRDAREIAQAPLATAWARGLAIAPDGGRAVVAGDDGTLSIWNLRELDPMGGMMLSGDLASARR